MKYHLFFLLVFTSFFACQNTETIENKDDSGVLTERFSRLKGTEIKHGKYQSFYPGGQIFEESNYVKDSLDGVRTLYYENGKVQSIEQLQNGKYIGKYQKFSETGQLILEGDYVDNEMSGIWKGFYDTGELKEEVTFAHNEENGAFKEYHKNGKLMTEGAYQNGDREQGELKKYDENGELAEVMLCDYGVCMTTWLKDKGDVPIDSARLRGIVEKLKMLDEN